MVPALFASATAARRALLGSLAVTGLPRDSYSVRISFTDQSKVTECRACGNDRPIRQPDVEHLQGADGLAEPVHLTLKGSSFGVQGLEGFGNRVIGHTPIVAEGMRKPRGPLTGFRALFSQLVDRILMPVDKFVNYTDGGSDGCITPRHIRGAARRGRGKGRHGFRCRCLICGAPRSFGAKPQMRYYTREHTSCNSVVPP
jgi:hypothetical protein